MRKTLLPIVLMLGACVPGTSHETVTRATIIESSLPPMKTFARGHLTPQPVSNSDLMRDFMDLSFKLESGRDLPTLTRFEGPITVRLKGPAPIYMQQDIDRLLSRLRREAGINITRTTSEAANITVQAVPQKEIRKNLPTAACFVVPNINDINQYSAAKRSRATDWAKIARREKMAIFLPSDTSPQEIRDCLHEELAQALGPLNDLYRLPDSVFNDDNIHTVLTGYDMKILRAYYAPELKNGMSRKQVADRLPAILARLNPQGQNIAPLRTASTPRAWIEAIQTALGPGTSPQKRKVAAREALKIAKVMGWQDHRRAFSHYAMGRIAQANKTGESQGHFLQADKYYAMSPKTRLHRAYIAAQMAAHAVANNDPKRALALTTPYLKTVGDHENAALLSTLLMLRAEALDMIKRPSEASMIRLDSLGWARYGFGADWAVRAKQREIAALRPR